jgi:hypothetical protein
MIQIIPILRIQVGSPREQWPSGAITQSSVTSYKPFSSCSLKYTTQLFWTQDTEMVHSVVHYTCSFIKTKISHCSVLVGQQDGYNGLAVVACTCEQFKGGAAGLLSTPDVGSPEQVIKKLRSTLGTADNETHHPENIPKPSADILRGLALRVLIGPFNAVLPDSPGHGHWPREPLFHSSLRYIYEVAVIGRSGMGVAVNDIIIK